jgi:hypothetical protein
MAAISRSLEGDFMYFSIIINNSLAEEGPLFLESEATLGGAFSN